MTWPVAVGKGCISMDVCIGEIQPDVRPGHCTVEEIDLYRSNLGENTGAGDPEATIIVKEKCRIVPIRLV